MTKTTGETTTFKVVPDDAQDRLSLYWSLSKFVKQNPHHIPNYAASLVYLLSLLPEGPPEEDILCKRCQSLIEDIQRILDSDKN